MYQIVCKHLLQVPYTCFDLSLTKSDPNNLQKTENENEINSKNFICYPPINPFKRINKA